MAEHKRCRDCYEVNNVDLANSGDYGETEETERDEDKMH